MKDVLAKLESVLTGSGYYEVHFPDGSVRRMSWDDLHVTLKRESPDLHRTVRYRWIDELDSENSSPKS